MENLLIYCLKVNIIFTALFTIYYFFLRKQKLLLINRIILIGMVWFAFSLPMAPNILAKPLIDAQIANPETAEGNSVTYKLVPNTEQTVKTQVLHQLDWQKLAVNLYLIISVILFLKLIYSLIKLLIIIQKSKVHRFDGIIYCEPLFPTAPFSFFNYIIIAKTDIKPNEYQQIIIHEQAHVRQLHSVDVLFAELVSIILWMNPLTYLYKRQVKLNLEFLADEITLNSGIDSKTYQLSLLAQSTYKSYLPANYFFTSKLKERIYMINKRKPSTCFNYHYFLLPFAMLMLNFVLCPKLVKSSPPLKKDIIVSKKKEYLINNQIEKLTIKRKPEPKNLKNITDTQIPNISQIYINATTDTVKIKLTTDNKGLIKPFKGIYVIEDLVMSDNELRERIKMRGEQLFIMPKRPQIGIYNENDSTAVRKWGKRAENGVIYVIANYS